MSIGNAEASTSKRKHQAEAEAEAAAGAGAPIKRRKSRGEDVEVDAAAAVAAPAPHALSQTRDTEDEDGEDEAGKGMSATGPSQRPHGCSLAAALSTTSADALRSALSTLRRETRCAVDSAGAREAIAASDGRIALVTQLLTAPSHHGQDDQLPSALASLLAAWDLADAQSLPTLIPLPLFCLAQMLTLLSAHQPTHEMGEAVISALLPPRTQALEASGNGRAPAASSSSSGAYWRRMQAYLVAGQGQGASHGAARGAATKNETLTLATSRLMLAMSCFAGSKYASRIFDAVSWSGSGAMPRLITMRRMRSRKGGHKTSRGSTVANPGTFDSPDVRTLWTLLLLSFLRAGSPALSSAVLDLGRPYVPAIVSGLSVDSPEMVVHTLQVLHDSLLVDDGPAAARSALRVPRSKVVALFNEWCIKEILKLYDRKDQTDVVDGEGNRLAVGDVAHHFLTTLCTHPGRGVCFVDRGWYAKASQQPNEEATREGIEGSEMADGELAAGRLGALGDNDESELGAQRSPRVYNKILLGVSRALSPSRSLPQQQLTIDILRAAPELIGAYFDSPSGSGLSSSSLEPRPHSSAWVSSVSFLSRVLALPLPERREDTPSTPPPFKNLVAALLPSPLTRAQLQKGLASPDRLVQHITMRLLTRLLDRLVRFKEACHSAISDLQQGEPDSAKAVEQSRNTTLDTSANPWDGLVQPSNVVDQWKKRWGAVEKEARRRLPDVASIITNLSAQALAKETSAAPCQTDGQTSPATRQGQGLLLEEGRLRVLLYYCQVTPASALPEAARLDYVRLLLAQSAGVPMAALCRLHALRILSLCIGEASELRAAPLDVFATISSASSSASSPKTFFGLLLQLLARDSQESGKASALIRSTCSQALIGVMRESVLFEHDPAEWTVWVHTFSGAPNVDSPDRADHVRAFLEDCASRCRKTHHRYLEMSRKHREENTVSDGLSRGIVDTDLAASPLMATLVEQLSIRLRKQLLDEADVVSGIRGTMQRRALVGYAARLLVLLLSSGRPAHPLLAWARELHAAAQTDHDVFVVSEMGHALQLIEVVAEGRKPVQASPDLLAFAQSIFSMPVVDLLCCGEPIKNAETLTRTDLRMAVYVGLSNSKSDPTCLHFIPDLLATCSVSEPKLLLHIILRSRALLDAFKTDSAGSHSWLRLLQHVSLLDESDEQDRAAVSVFATALEASLQRASTAPFGGQTSLEDVDRVLQCAVPFVRFITSVGLDCLAKLLALRLQQQSVPQYIERLTEAVVSLPTSDFATFFNHYDGPSCALHSLTFADDSHKEGSGALLSLAHLGLSTPARPGSVVGPAGQTVHALLPLWTGHRDGADAVFALILERRPNLASVFFEKVNELRKASDLNLDACIASGPRTLHVALTIAAQSTSWSIDDDLCKSLVNSLPALVFNPDARLASDAAAVALAVHDYEHHKSTCHDQLISALVEGVPLKPQEAAQQVALDLVTSLANRDLPGTAPLAQKLVQQTLLWLVRRFAEDEEDTAAIRALIDSFGSLLSTTSLSPKAHLVEPVIVAAVRNRLRRPEVMALVAKLFRTTMDLKSGFRAQQISAILSHASFKAAVSVSTNGTHDEKARSAVLHALHAAMASDPASLCRPATVSTLVRAYGGTLSRADRTIMQVLELFEGQERASVISIAASWSPQGPLSGLAETSNSPFDGIASLDPSTAFNTCAAFPRGRAFRHRSSSMRSKATAYDPLFVLSLLSAMLLDDSFGQLTGLQWLVVLRSNALGIAACCLSSRSASLRDRAARVLGRAYAMISRAAFQEREHLLLVLDSLRDSRRHGDDPLALSTTLFVAHAFRAISAPGSLAYPLVSRFLLQRPDLRLEQDIPMLYNTLLSDDDEHHARHRLWMLRFLRDVVKSGGSNEWRIMRRRRVWELLSSMYSASVVQRSGQSSTRSLIQEICLLLAERPHVSQELLQRRGLVAWIAQHFSLERSSGDGTQSQAFGIALLRKALQSANLVRLTSRTDAAWIAASLDVLESAGLEGVVEDGATILELLMRHSRLLQRDSLGRTVQERANSMLAAMLDLPDAQTISIKRIIWKAALCLDANRPNARELVLRSTRQLMDLGCEEARRLWLETAIASPIEAT